MAARIERNRRRPADDLAATIKRLRVSKQDSVSGDRKQGKTAGYQWAKDSAEAADLARLAAFDADQRRISKAPGSAGGTASAGAPVGEKAWRRPAPPYAQHVAEAVSPDEDPLAFWTRALGLDDLDDYPEEAFAHAFVLGALELWSKVESRI